MAKAKAQKGGGSRSGGDPLHGSSGNEAAGAGREDIGLLASTHGTNGGDDDDDDIFGDEHGRDSGSDGSMNKARAATSAAALEASKPGPPSRTASGTRLPPSLVMPSANGSGSVRTPRTPNRVRFDLTAVDDEPQSTARNGDGNANGNGNGTAPRRLGVNHDYSDDDDDDDLDHFDLDMAPENLDRQHRLPLLTDIEAPSVTLARSGEIDTRVDVEEWAERERSRPKSGLSSAFMNMANSIIGAGIIGQPYAMKQAGLVAGTMLLVVLTVAVDWTIRLIVVNSKLSGASSFQGTVEHCFGRTGLIAISLAQWVFAFGGMVAFGVIVGDSIPHVLTAVWPGLHDVPALGLLTDRRAVIVVFILAVSYPLTLYRDIAKLAKASTFALVSMIVIIVTVVVQGAMVPAEERGSFSRPLLTVNSGIFQAIGVISFAFVCHHNSLLIYGSLKTPTIDRFSRVTHISTAVSMVACMLMALAGFLTFGDKTLGNVLNNFPADNTMVNIARLCFGLNMLTTLPLEAFVCREVMFNYYFPNEPFNMHLHLIFSTSLVVSAMTLSLITCDLGAIFELVGATSACAMAYILPPLCYIKLTTRSWRTYVAIGVVVFGCAVMGISLLQAVGKIIKGEGGTAQCR
ncbi:hypothetical protein SCUCBS95973_000397 [Sporothrix curviconia]|uniref:Amino acid transporter transmembrane domain-containing protein n=1 Tax=Sporothrix curviconia TaxID=1260050 RepID=A0ABP0APY0_9PEZI